jgi:hypothetical protein
MEVDPGEAPASGRKAPQHRAQSPVAPCGPRTAVEEPVRIHVLPARQRGLECALAVLRKAAGDLERIRAIAHVTVFTQCSDTFTQQSEVADGASDALVAVLGDAGRHTRTSIGVYQLPKNATVELELVATT